MANLKSRIDQLANDFVNGVLEAVANASVSEISELGGRKAPAKKKAAPAPAAEAAPAKAAPARGRRAAAKRGRPAKAAPARAAAKRGGRRARRSSEDVEALAVKVGEYVGSSGGNVAVSDIAKALKVGTAEVNRPVVIALNRGLIRKQGEKRLTRYYPVTKGRRRKKG